MVEMFQEWYDSRHEYARNWKERTEGKVVGFILGDASGWEYGVPILDAMGFQRGDMINLEPKI